MQACRGQRKTFAESRDRNSIIEKVHDGRGQNAK